MIKFYHYVYIITIRSLPNIFWPLRKIIIKRSLKYCGKHVKIGTNVFILYPQLVSIGDNSFIGDKSSISGNVPIHIGNNVMFGPEVMVRGGDHNITQVGVPMRFVKVGGKNLSVVIENDVWIGARVIILKGVRIGEGSVIGAGSIVTKDIIPYTINVGNPAEPIRLRFSEKDLQNHLSLLKSRYNCFDLLSRFKSSISEK